VILSRAIAIVCTALELGILASLLLSGTWKVSKAFFAYMVAVAVPDFLFVVWPASYVWPFWITKEMAQSALKLAMALEIMVLVFAGLPRARRAAENVLALLLVVTLFRLSLAHLDGLHGSFIEWIAIVNNGTAFAFCAVFILALWYRMPMHPLHRAILAGLIAYLVGISMIFNIVGSSWSALHRNGQALGYALVLILWLNAAWQREAIPEGAPLEELRPWA
jgi:hypothetical protein